MKLQLAICVVTLALLTGCQWPRGAAPGSGHGAMTPAPGVALPSSVGEPVVSSEELGTIEEYVQLGLERNPQIAEAQHRIEAARFRIPQALALPDPMVSTTTHLAPVQTAAGEQAFALGVSQKYTQNDRRAAQAAIASEEVAAAEADWNRICLETAERIRTACYQLLLVRTSIDITDQERASLEQIADVILREYEVKRTVTQQDVLAVQTEQSRLENELTELRQRERSYQARLARLLHVSPDSKLQIAGGLATESASLDVDALIAQATLNRPDLQAKLATIRQNHHQVHLAHLQAKPDFTVGLNWIATSTSGISPVANGDDALLLGIGFNLPVNQGRIRAAVCEAEANRRASEAGYANLQDVAAEEIFDLVAKLESTRAMLTLLQQDMLPKSERVLSLALDEYSVGKTDYMQLIANWRSVLRFKVAEASMQAQHNQLLASLARAAGQLEPFGDTGVEIPLVSPPATIAREPEVSDTVPASQTAPPEVE